MTDVHTIQITVGGDQLQYRHPDGSDASSFHAAGGHTVEWLFDGLFAVHFGIHNPFEHGPYFRGGPKVGGTVKRTAEPGKYKYIVAAIVPGQPPLVDDPEMIID